MLRSAVIGTLVACLIGFAVLDAQMGGDGYSEAVVTDESAGTGTDAPAIPAAAPSDAAVSADETASDPQEPAAAQDSWAENRPPAGTPRSLPKQLFPANNWWNLNISQAPVDPKSANFITSIGTGNLRYDWGNNYGLPYVTVSGNYPKVRFQACSYWSQTDKVEYPIPVPALTEPGWTEDLKGTIDNPVSTGDRHLLIVDVDNQFLYEIYQPYRNATGSPKTMPNGTILQPGSFYCASAAMWDMKTNNTRPDGWTSSDAAGLQVLPGLVQYRRSHGPGSDYARASHHLELELEPVAALRLARDPFRRQLERHESSAWHAPPPQGVEGHFLRRASRTKGPAVDEGLRRDLRRQRRARHDHGNQRPTLGQLREPHPH